MLESDTFRFFFVTNLPWPFSVNHSWSFAVELAKCAIQ
jgi:hypothetical protein